MIPSVLYQTYINCPHCKACIDTEEMSVGENYSCDYCRGIFTTHPDVDETNPEMLS